MRTKWAKMLSELIKELQELETEHGDQPVRMYAGGDEPFVFWSDTDEEYYIDGIEEEEGNK